MAARIPGLTRLLITLAMLGFSALVGLFESRLLDMGGVDRSNPAGVSFRYAWQLGLWLAIALTAVAVIDLVLWQGIVARYRARTNQAVANARTTGGGAAPQDGMAKGILRRVLELFGLRPSGDPAATPRPPADRTPGPGEA